MGLLHITLQYPSPGLKAKLKKGEHSLWLVCGESHNRIERCFLFVSWLALA